MRKPISLFLIGLSCLTAALFFSSGAMAGEGVISLNKAGIEEIKALFVNELDLPGELADSLVNYRKTHGDFKAPEDLIKVPGMTQDFIEEINPQVENNDVVYDPEAEPALAPSKC